jgi:hypothetical protein
MVCGQGTIASARRRCTILRKSGSESIWNGRWLTAHHRTSNTLNASCVNLSDPSWSLVLFAIPRCLLHLSTTRLRFWVPHSPVFFLFRCRTPHAIGSYLHVKVYTRWSGTEFMAHVMRSGSSLRTRLIPKLKWEYTEDFQTERAAAMDRSTGKLDQIYILNWHTTNIIIRVLPCSCIIHMVKFCKSYTWARARNWSNKDGLGHI